MNVRAAMPRKPSKKTVEKFARENFKQDEESQEKIKAIFSENPKLYYATKDIWYMFGLLEKFEIDKDDPDCWYQLCMHLVMDNLEGFKVIKQKGAGSPRKWGYGELETLYIDVEFLLHIKRKKHGYNIGSACRDLCQRDKYKNYDVKTLRNKYSEAKKLPFIKRAREEIAADIKETAEI